MSWEIFLLILVSILGACIVYFIFSDIKKSKKLGKSIICLGRDWSGNVIATMLNMFAMFCFMMQNITKDEPNYYMAAIFLLCIIFLGVLACSGLRKRQLMENGIIGGNGIWFYDNIRSYSIEKYEKDIIMLRLNIGKKTGSAIVWKVKEQNKEQIINILDEKIKLHTEGVWM